MTWKVDAADRLLDSLLGGLPQTAVIAVATADEDGPKVLRSKNGPTEGRFEIGSITKTMTGAVLASLVDDGIVALDDEIGRWLDAGPNADITLRQLATHTAGLPRLSPSHVLGATDPYLFLTPHVAEEELRRCPVRPRGVESDYSNFGFQLLGLVLERADGTSFPKLLQQRLFDPLGMTSSGVPKDGEPVTIAGHINGVPTAPWSRHLYGAGGVLVSGDDLARYLNACLNPPDSAAGWAIRQAQQPDFQIDPLRSAGLGWPQGPPGYLGHDGGTAGFRSGLGIKTTTRRAAAIVVNDKSAHGLMRAIRYALDAE
ncbi:putative Serine-type D-Ala-D-Ala carboxypeptidase [Nostocoides japonicum T1-X7]|uniref:Putative Serine-type D-Ala-D-Ala carboxypeptidase n=1 Tax=Nostocoides japonicum T1-X7 TaxID=1194083 RepID=A0A077M2I1_9MICO|nr:serine hydrolase domain-containing protein [Tetrasphaera japonica]CCH78445.1 putative Serine-type D-Ala-D-Ala carboxypeptidase [Tetrasphaera japonica T1-X7]